MSIRFIINRWLIIIPSLFLLACFSCKKLVEVNDPDAGFPTDKVFADDRSARAAIAGLYNRMLVLNLSIANGGLTVYSGLSADELVPTSTSSGPNSFYKNAILANSSIIQNNFWIPAYKTIYHANAILEALEASTQLSDSVRKQAKGEALLIRALHYFYLANLFGDVPLVTTTNYAVNSNMPRTALPLIEEQLLNDLNAAATLLDILPRMGKATANRYTVAALLARVYLYAGQWDQAEAQASLVLHSGQYVLGNLHEVFLKSSSETIWQLASDIGNTAEGAAFQPVSASVRPAYELSNGIQAAFEPGDQRRTAWLDSSTTNGRVYVFPRKYRSRSADPVTESYVVLRLTEQYLIRAEARAQQGNIAGALDDLNRIRLRAGLNAFSANTLPAVLDAIEREWRIEFFCEWGHRWLDLKRWNKADVVLSMTKGANWQPTDKLYPIPASQLQTNLSLVQNPGY